MSFLKNIFVRKSKHKTESFTPPPPPTANAIARAEAALFIRFPASFVSFVQKARSMELPLCAELYLIGEESLGASHIVAANLRERQDELPTFLVVFYNDGMGNRICFDTRHSVDGEYPIVFWDHELDAAENLAASKQPSVNYESAGRIAESFSEWLKRQYEMFG